MLDLAEKPQYLALVQQKPPRPQGVTVEDIALFVRGNVHSVNEHLTVVDLAVALLKVKLALTD